MSEWRDLLVMGLSQNKEISPLRCAPVEMTRAVVIYPAGTWLPNRAKLLLPAGGGRKPTLQIGVNLNLACHGDLYAGIL